MAWPTVYNHLQGQVIQVEILICPHACGFVLLCTLIELSMTLKFDVHGETQVIVQITKEICSLSFIWANRYPVEPSLPPLPPNALPILGCASAPECQDRSSPVRQALSHPAALQSQRAPCTASSASERTQKDKWRANITQMCTCKNSPVITAAHERGGSSNRWPCLSHFLIPEVVPLCFPSISLPGTWFWQAEGPLESTVSFKVFPEWCAIEANAHATKNVKPRV